jgi:hypothetical protein
MRSLATRLVYANFHITVAYWLISSVCDLYEIFTHWDYYQHEWFAIPDLEMAYVGQPLILIFFLIFLWLSLFIWKLPHAAEATAMVGLALLFVCGLCGAVLVLVGNSVYERQPFRFQWGLVYLGTTMLIFAAVYYDRQSRW